MEIRRSTPNDATAIADIEDVCFPDGWERKDILSYITSDTGMCFTALADGKPIAYLLGRLIAPEAEIYRIAVLPDYRQRGIGYRLLSYALKTERGRGLECAFLEVREGNVAARALYRSFGFSEMGMRKNYYKNPTEDAVVMVLNHGNNN